MTVLSKIVFFSWTEKDPNPGGRHIISVYAHVLCQEFRIASVRTFCLSQGCFSMHNMRTLDNATLVTTHIEDYIAIKRALQAIRLVSTAVRFGLVVRRHVREQTCWRHLNCSRLSEPYPTAWKNGLTFRKRFGKWIYHRGRENSGSKYLAIAFNLAKITGHALEERNFLNSQTL